LAGQASPLRNRQCPLSTTSRTGSAGRILRRRRPGVGHLRAHTGAISSHTIPISDSGALGQISPNRVSLGLQRFSLASLKGQGFSRLASGGVASRDPSPGSARRRMQVAGCKVLLALIKERSGDGLADPMRIGASKGSHHRGWGWVSPRLDSTHPNVPAAVPSQDVGNWTRKVVSWAHGCMGGSVLGCPNPPTLVGNGLPSPKPLPDRCETDGGRDRPRAVESAPSFGSSPRNQWRISAHNGEPFLLFNYPL
jgi:hypothetical protein